MKKGLLLLTALFLLYYTNAQDSVTVREYEKTFPTYPFSDPNPIPLLTQVYPYFRFDGFTDKPVNKQWKVVEIENAYIRLLITPEIGGKIWAAIDKKNNQPFLYYNHSVKFRDIAMRGPWTSGGLESNFGIIGHTPNCATPVDYVVTHEEDGSVTCTIGALDLLTRSNWRMKINVPKDKAFFTTQAFWYNTTPTEQPYYHWMNAAAKASDDLEFIYPGNKYLGHNGEYASWPVNEQNGKKISWYRNNDFGGYKSYHVWGKYTDFFGTYYHNENTGMVRYSTHDDKAGKKIWIWGLSDQGMIWEKQLTDTDGQYVEVQSGRLFNQNAEASSYTPFKHIALTPYQSDSWKEYWYPVKNIGGIVKANEYGAFNMKYEQGWLTIYYYPVQAITDELIVKEGGKVLYRKQLQLQPEEVFIDSLQIATRGNQLTATLGNQKMRYEADSGANVLHRPVETPKNFDWTSAYGLYLLGSEQMDEKLYPQAEEKLSASLQKDSNFLPALVAMSKLMYRNMRYKEGLQLSLRAISINAMAGDANYYYGLINEELGNITDAKDGFEIAALDPACRSAAYTELASIYCKENDTLKALDYAGKALVYNAYNISALQLRAAIFRKQQNRTLAETIWKTIQQQDPLNHFVLYEKYKTENKPEDKQTFLSSVRAELPSEVFEELAIWYYKQGFTEEAKELFRLSPPSFVSTCWLSFLNGDTIDFNRINPAFSFPFRSETAAVIDTLLQRNPNWLLKYQLALIYHDRNRLQECKALLASCGNEPAFAPFYAVRAAIAGDSDKATREADLQKAISLEKSWRYYKLLSEFYLAQNQYQPALQAISPYAKKHPDDYRTGLLYTKTLLLTNQLAEADKVLSNLKVLPFEGATESHDIFREIKLKKAIDAMRKKQWNDCLRFIKEGESYPSHLGTGKPYEEDIDDRLENWLLYLCYNQMKNGKADSLLRKIVQFGTSKNNERNVQGSNALVTLWAYDKMNKKEEGRQWIIHQLSIHPADKDLLWAKDMWEEKPTEDIKSNSNERILLYLVK